MVSSTLAGEAGTGTKDVSASFESSEREKSYGRVNDVWCH